MPIYDSPPSPSTILQHIIIQDVLATDSHVISRDFALRHVFADESLADWCSQHALKYRAERYPRLNNDGFWDFIIFERDHSETEMERTLKLV